MKREPSPLLDKRNKAAEPESRSSEREDIQIKRMIFEREALRNRGLGDRLVAEIVIGGMEAEDNGAAKAIFLSPQNLKRSGGKCGPE